LTNKEEGEYNWEGSAPRSVKGALYVESAGKCAATKRANRSRQGRGEGEKRKMSKSVTCLVGKWNQHEEMARTPTLTCNMSE